MPDQRSPMPDRGRESHWPHRFALFTALATFPLLFIGGLVTSKGAGLAVPDWPTTFGHNMFLYPWSKMVGDIFYEHSHRLVASGVGLLTIALAVVLWLYERRWWVRWLGIAALALVIVQGVIGGLRVVLLQETLAIVHACLAQAFFALTVCLVFFTSGEWRAVPQPTELAAAGSLRRVALLTTAMIYLQGILGAVLRYTGKGIELHLFFAALVALHAILLSVRLFRLHLEQERLVRPALLLIVLLMFQLTLGLGSYLARFTSLGIGFAPSWVIVLRTSHVVTGALMLVISLVLTFRSYRFLALPESIPGHGFRSEQVPL